MITAVPTPRHVPVHEPDRGLANSGGGTATFISPFQVRIGGNDSAVIGGSGAAVHERRTSRRRSTGSPGFAGHRHRHRRGLDRVHGHLRRAPRRAPTCRTSNSSTSAAAAASPPSRRRTTAARTTRSRSTTTATRRRRSRTARTTPPPGSWPRSRRSCRPARPRRSPASAAAAASTTPASRSRSPARWRRRTCRSCSSVTNFSAGTSGFVERDRQGRRGRQQGRDDHGDRQRDPGRDGSGRRSRSRCGRRSR